MPDVRSKPVFPFLGVFCPARRALATALLLTVAWGAARAADRAPSPDPAPPAADRTGAPDADSPRKPRDHNEVRVREEVRVTAARLPGPADRAEKIPAHVTVITRDRIEASGARTLQDLLALEAGVTIHDQVGNGIQQTLDLRGFTGGSGVAVFLDGARLNNPRNNAVALHLVPLEAVERIEIIRGPAAALAGGGAEAGVVHIVTRRGEEPGVTVSAEEGTFGTSRFSASASGSTRRFDYAVEAATGTTDGFRVNSRGDRDRVTATAGMDLGEDRRLSLSLLSSSADLGTPGALTLDEWAADPDQSPFNAADFLNETMRLAALNFQGGLAGGFSLSANLFHRAGDTDSLTTGRSAPVFGGFLLKTDGSTDGATLQTSRLFGGDGREDVLTAGVEWSDGTTDALGFFTPPEAPDRVDLAVPGSNNRVDRTAVGLFVQNVWKPSPRLSLLAGARHDRDRSGYSDRMAGTPGETRTFSETSLRAGVTFSPSERSVYYLTYSEAFLPPTAEQLFAFPGFGSNPGLAPQDSRAVEFGVRRRWSDRAALDAALFRSVTEDEIVFDPTPDTENPFGRNVNAGRTRRVGLELSARGRLGKRLRAFANVTLLDAEFRDDRGGARGSTVPLVPRKQAATGVRATLPKGFRVSAEALYVGEQVLDNDDANQAARLAGFTVVNLRLAWDRADRGGRRGPGAFFEVHNLLDREYATRGIWAFDFSTFQNAVFVNPAAGRRYNAGVRWRF